MVTYEQIAIATLIMVAIVLMLGGMLAAFGAGMASSPTPESDRTSRRGCIAFILGVVLLVGSIAWIALH